MFQKTLNLTSPLLMAVLNTTPDSFSDGGKFLEKEKIEKRIDEIIAEGADIIDIGGESSAPNSVKVSAKEEIQRILPALEYCKNKKIIISLDTYKSEVAKIAIQNGTQIINDVTALRGDEKMADLIAKKGVYVVLMYSKNNSARTTREVKKYQNVIAEIKDFLAERIEFAVQSGIEKEKIIIDPGMGAFVSAEPEPSLQILKNLAEFKTLGCPILIGASRKSFIGQILDLPIEERLEGSLASACIAVYNGANILRAHDILSTKRVLKMTVAIARAGEF